MQYVDGANLYLAVRGNPTIYTDPTGTITGLFKRLLNFLSGGESDLDCTEWVFSEARNHWRRTKVEVAVDQPLTLPATDLIDFIFTLNDAAGRDGPSLTTWNPIEDAFKRHNDPRLLDIWNGVRNGSQYTKCRCHWVRNIREKRTCCDGDGKTSTQTRSRAEKTITYGVVNIIVKDSPFCHCPAPDQENPWRLPATLDELRDAPKQPSWNRP